MFHTLYKAFTILLAPCLCILAEYRNKKQRKINFDKLDIFCKWFLFWSLGVSAVTAGFMQILNPSYTAALLHVSTNDFVVIQELGFANFSMGLLAVISLKWKKFRLPSAIVYGTYIFLCALIHISRMDVISYGEVVSLAADICIAAVAAITIWKECRK